MESQPCFSDALPKSDFTQLLSDGQRPVLVPPHRSSQTIKSPAIEDGFSEPLHKLLARAEQTIGNLKRIKRAGMRHKKTELTCSTIFSLASGLMLVKCVHKVWETALVMADNRKSTGSPCVIGLSPKKILAEHDVSFRQTPYIMNQLEFLALCCIKLALTRPINRK